MKQTLHNLRTLNLKPTFKFKRHLDPPWTDALGTSIKVVSGLILVNTTLILLLGIISAASTNLAANKTKNDSTYIKEHTMLLLAELIFFYLTIPVVWVASNVTENWVLWEDKLRPLYVICAAVIAINIWILQMTLWGPCMFAPAASDKDGGMKGPGYCPYLFRDESVDLRKLQTVGSPSMAFYCVPSLLILYIVYLILGVIAFRQERKRPEPRDKFEMSGPYASSAPGSEQSLPFRMSWGTGNSPPLHSGKNSPERGSLVSPKAQKQTNNNEEVGETTPSLTDEPAIALLLTTPHGTTEEQDPFDDDRLSRLGHRTR